MNLDPTPKPIRYRISSGGVEHSSLDSLRYHFCWKDVKELIGEKRIQEWLKKINKDNVAESIERADNEHAPDWSMAAIFFGLDGASFNGWLPLVKYWFDQGFEKTISLNEDEWAKNDLDVARLKSLRLPATLLERMVDYQYDNLPPEVTEKEVKRLVDLGSEKAKKKLLELQEKKRIEAEKKKEEAQRKAQEEALRSAQQSKSALKKHWMEGHDLKRFSFASSLNQQVSFLHYMQDLLEQTKNSLNIKRLADFISDLENKAVGAGAYRDYYLCSIAATYRLLPHEYPDEMVKHIAAITPNGVSEAIKKRGCYGYFGSPLFHHLIKKDSLYRDLSWLDNTISNHRGNYNDCYLFYHDYIIKLGSDLLNQEY